MTPLEAAAPKLLAAVRAVVDRDPDAVDLCRDALAEVDAKPVRRDPPLPPLSEDSISILAREAAASFKRKPPQNPGEKFAFERLRPVQ